MTLAWDCFNACRAVLDAVVLKVLVRLLVAEEEANLAVVRSVAGELVAVLCARGCGDVVVNSYGVAVQDTTVVIVDSVNFIGPFPKK